jgi:hypothetical protein
MSKEILRPQGKPAQPEQEQNEFALRGKLATLLCWHRLTQEEEEDLLRFVAAQQEPVAWRYRTGTFFNREIHWRYMDSLEGAEKLLGIQALYTSPQQRPWVSLTDEDKHLIELSAGITEDDDGYIVSQVFKLTEAKLRSKNNAT